MSRLIITNTEVCTKKEFDKLEARVRILEKKLLKEFEPFRNPYDTSRIWEKKKDKE
jgi:hypothetical protein